MFDLGLGNPAAATSARYEGVQRLLQVQSERIPAAVAVAAPGRAPLTYGALWTHIDTVAHELRALGIARHDRVAMVLPQGPELATAFVAVCACATAAPLNPSYRASEFEFYLAALRAKALLIQAQVDSPARSVARARGIPIIELSPVVSAAAGIFTLAGERRRHPVDDGFARSGDVALVLHTSGTTGRPKGVPLTHANLCASARNIAATLLLSEHDRCLNLMPLFHIHGLVGGTLASMATGSSLVCPPGFYAPQFFEWLDEFRPTWYTAVPAMHQAILKRARERRDFDVVGSLRLIRSSSASLPTRVMTELENLFQVPVIEAYGMTEASHQITSNPLPPKERKPGSVGRAIGTEVAIMDEAGRVLPAGSVGEIVIRGANVMTGYEDDSTENREGFTRGWFRTGDQGYRDEEGYFFITGRLKEMINRAGEKISPREVDDVLLDHPAVTQAVTFAVPHPILGEDVAAAVVLQEKVSAGEREIQQFAAERLADFKVPRKILIVDKLPETPTGKLRRMDLAGTLGVETNGNMAAVAGADYAPHRTALEKKLVAIWSEVLGVDRVGIHDNFYALGGDSILAAQIIARARERIRIDLSFLDFLEKATVAGLSERFKESDQILPLLARLSVSGRFLPEGRKLPLSYAQERLWFLEQMKPGSSAYNRPTFYRLTGSLDAVALEKGLNEISRRHEILRTTFSSIDGEAFQVISPHRALHVTMGDLRALSKTARDAEARRLAVEEAKRPFDLATGPLFRVTLLRLADDEHLLLLVFHHIVFDGWSEGILLRELMALYGAFCAGKSSPLPDLAIQYADFAVWQRQWLNGKMLAAQVSYWSKHLEGAPDLIALPTDRPRPAVQTFPGARAPVSLSEALTKTLKALSQEAEASLFMTLAAAFQALLWRATGQTDISIGTFNANRTRVETEGLIGFFVNNLVLRTDLSGSPSFRELLLRVRAVCLGAYAHRDLPFETLLEKLRPKRSSSHSPLFQVMLVLQNSPKPPLHFPGLTLQRYPAIEQHESAFDLTLELSEEAGGLTGHLEYNTDLFDADRIVRMGEDFEQLLKTVVVDPDKGLSSLKLDAGAGDELDGRRARLRQRRDNLSAAKQAALAQRLSGGIAGATAESHYSEQRARPLILKPRLRIAEHGAAPLSFAQQRLWFLDRLEPGTSLYHISSAVRLAGPLDLSALRQALCEIVNRHEVLRTTFVASHGEPLQHVAESANVKLPIIDLSERPQAEAEAEAQVLIQQAAERPFDLSSDPMLRAVLVRLGEEESMFVLTTHHIASDGWSMGILFRELADLYGAFSGGRPSLLPELPIQYADFAVWQRELLQGEVLEKQLAYWRHRLTGLPALNLTTDHPRPAMQSYRGGHRSFSLSKSLSGSLKTLSRRQGVSLFMTLLAAFQTLLCRYTGQDDVAVGTPIAGRTRTETEGLIGFFVNMLVLRSDLSGNPPFAELLARVREVALDAYANQDLPFEKLVEDLKPERDASRHPLFQTMFALQNAPTEALEMAGLRITPLHLSGVKSKFDLSLSMFDTEQGLRGSLTYNSDLYDGSTIARMLDHFQTLLHGIIAGSHTRLSDLPILREEEKQRLLEEWNDTKRAYSEVSIDELFEAQVERSPDAVAVVLEDKQLTYRELNRRANQLAHHLRKLGVGPEVLVGIYMERSVEILVGLLGVLKSGGAYVPLDPNHPVERLAGLLDDIQPQVLLSQQRLIEATRDSNPRYSFLDSQSKVICLDSEWEMLSQESEHRPAIGATTDDLAYVIYTSGSSGKPKGVMVTHGSLVHAYLAWEEAYQLRQATTVHLQMANFSFDVFSGDWMRALCSGGKLVLCPPEFLLDAPELYRLMLREKVDCAEFVPAVMRNLFQYLEENKRTLEFMRVLVVGSETWCVEEFQKVKSLCGPNTELINSYGLTEATIDSSYFRGAVQCSALDRPVPIGRPFPNTQLYILDGFLQPVPVGVPGELHIGGTGLARGYLNLADLTAEKFIPNPFGDEPGARLYKTGDRVRYLPGGDIEFLGRVDHQVKIRGFRIELGEIEAILSQHPAVRETLVVALADAPGDQRLVAYVALKSGQTLAAAEARSFLEAKVPEYMVPSGFVFRDRLPLTPNGKLDRNALLATRPTRFNGEDAYAPARDALELQLTRVWERLLRTRPIGLKDNFFDLGGHSLLAVRLISQVEKVTGRSLSLATLFQAPTIEEQAKVVRSEGWSSPWSSLVAIQPGGSKPPLFCVHAHDGNVLFWRDLSRRLGLDQPFYGLQAHGLDGKQAPDTRVEDMASRYVKEMRLLQSEGPYFLGGHCFGGLIAFEMAQQLHSQGERVALLALIDSFAPLGKPAPRGRLPLRYRIKHSLELIRLHIDNLRLLRWGEKVSYLEAKCNRLLYKIYMAVATSIPAAQARRRILDAGVQALRSYQPKVYPGSVTLFRAAEMPAGLRETPESRWAKLTEGGLEVHLIPGYFAQTVYEPRVQVLTEKLLACLESARTAASESEREFATR